MRLPMLPLKALVTALALLVPGGLVAGYAVHAVSDVADAPPANQAQALFGGEVVKSLAGKMPEGATTGAIDLRLFQGQVYVAKWDQPAFELTLLKPSGQASGQRLGDASLDVVFEGPAKETMDLKAVVKLKGAADVGVNDRSWDGFALVAFVPDALYSTVNLCSGSRSGMSVGLPAIPGLPFGDGGDACIPDAQPIGGDFSFNSQSGDEKPIMVPFGVLGLRMGEATISSQYGGILVAHATADKLALSTQYGSIMTNVTTTGSLLANTQYGSLSFVRTDAKLIEAESQYGGVLLSSDVRDDAVVKLATQYGGIKVLVPGSRDRGYVIDATTEYGRVKISLPDVEVKDANEADQGQSSTLSPLSLARALAPDAGPKSGGQGQSVHAETKGAAERANVMHMTLGTQYGSVSVMDSLIGATKAK